MSGSPMLRRVPIQQEYKMNPVIVDVCRILNMKSNCFIAAIFAVAATHTVAAVKNLDPSTYGDYSHNCEIATPEECPTLGYCVIERG